MTVVIPNLNGMAHLPGCLGSLKRQSFAAFDVIVVDNASRDGSLEWMAEHHPEVRTIALPVNGGFAKAVNAGIKATRGDYVALLNNDTVVDAHWLIRLVQALDAHADYDFGASKMIMLSDAGRLNAAGDTYDVTRLAGRNRGIGKSADFFARPERVLGACAGAAIYRRSLFDDVGLFDEDFFLMSEDTDFNLRCLVAGKRCLYVPDAVVWHKHRASIRDAPATKMRLLASRNEVMTAAKNLPLAVLFCPLPWLCRGLRQTVLVRPDHLSLVPVLLRETPRRVEAELKGATAGVEVRNTGVTSVGPGYLWTLRRVYPLLGQTLPERQVYDLLAGVALVRRAPDTGPIAVFGQGYTAPLAIYAAMLDPQVSEVILDSPPESHEDPQTPEFLGILRIGDLPQNLALLYPRPITFVGSVPPAYEWTRQLYEKLGAADRIRVVDSVQQWRPL